jgi:hypothetical protein
MHTHTHRNKHTQGVYEDSNLLWHDCVYKPLYHHDYGGNKFLKNVNYTPVDILSHDQSFNLGHQNWMSHEIYTEQGFRKGCTKNAIIECCKLIRFEALGITPCITNWWCLAAKNSFNIAVRPLYLTPYSLHPSKHSRVCTCNLVWAVSHLNQFSVNIPTMIKPFTIQSYLNKTCTIIYEQRSF